MPTNIFDMQDTWNASGSTFYAIRMNVNNAASAVGSRIMDLLTGGVSQFAVDPTNGVLVGNPAGGLKGVGTVNAQGLYINGVLISGTVKVSGTPTGGQLAQWINGDTLIGVAVSSLGYAPINNPVFTGDPQAPTPPPSDNDTSIATTAFVKTQLAAYQPLDGDLTSLAAAATNGTFYFRQAANSWKPVILGDGFVFDNLTGDLETTAPPGMGDVTAVDGPDPDDLAIFVGPTSIKGAKIGTGLSLDTVGTDRVLNASAASGGGNVSNANAPTGGQIAQWTDPTHIQGINPANLLTLIGGQPAGNYQPLDGDLTSIAGAGLTNSMYYRRLADAWDPVTIGAGLTFAGGVLASTGGGGTGTVRYFASTTQPASPNAGDLWYDLSNGVLSVYVNDGNSQQWVMIAPPGGTSVGAAPMDALAYNGIQINGSMEVNQELAGAATTVAVSHIVDGWKQSRNTATLVQSGQQVLTTAFPGFTNALELTVTTPQPTLAADETSTLLHLVEAYRMGRLGWGTANAQPLTIAFWTRHHRPGLYSVAFRNSAANRSYVGTYTQAVADVAQYNVITIPGDTTGAWTFDNGPGVTLRFALGVGSTQTAPAANTWFAQNYYAAPGQVTATGAGDVFRITGVVALPGTQAPTAVQSPLIMRSYGQELEVCKRYYRRLGSLSTSDFQIMGYVGAAAQLITGCFPLSPSMRAASTVTTFGTIATANVSGVPGFFASAEMLTVQITATAAGQVFYYGNPGGLVLDTRL